MIRRIAALAVFALAFASAGSAAAPSATRDCTWGASSVTATVGPGGTVEVGETHTTGCIP